jgi:hypothetical protein
LSAAVAGTATAVVEPGRAALFEREQKLCRLPLEAAFNELAAAVPELRRTGGLAREQGFKEPARPNQLRGFFFAEFLDDAHRLVGRIRTRPTLCCDQRRR